MQNDDDIDECMYENEDENDDDFVVEHVHWSIHMFMHHKCQVECYIQ